MLTIARKKFFNRYLPMLLSVVLIVGAVFGYQLFIAKNKVADAAWYSSSWTYRKPVIVDHNKVSGVASSTLNSFPMLINVTDNDLKFTGSGGKVASSTGADILFTNSDGTSLLNYEIESYASTTGQLIAWVRIPILSAVTDTTIYEYFGNASAPAESSGNITGTWDSNFAAIYHFSDNAANTTVLDSTSNARNGAAAANTNTKTTTGQFYKALSFNGSSDYVKYPNGTVNIGGGNITLEGWANLNNLTNVTTAQYYILADNCDGWFLRYYFDGSSALHVEVGQKADGSNEYKANNTFSYNPSGAWHHIAGTYDGTAWNIYFDGQLAGSLTTIHGPVSTNSAFCDQFVGGRNTNSGLVIGTVDEPRLSSSGRSADWIKTEYNNQSSPGTFYAYGALSIQHIYNLTPSGIAPWYSSAWSYRKPITIDHNKVSGAASSTLNSFPLAVSVIDPDLRYTGSGGKVASSTGADILFTDSSGTNLLNYEIESYSSSTGQLAAWVRIPVLSAITDTTIYEYFGNASAPAESSGNITATWDSNYRMVEHMADIASLQDSTGNILPGTNHSSSNTTGQIGGGSGFISGSSQYQDYATSTLLAPAAITFSAWIKGTSFPNAYNSVISREAFSAGYTLLVKSTGKLAIYVTDSAGGIKSYDGSGSNTLSTATWYYVTFTYSASGNLIGYVNGTVDGTVAASANGLDSYAGLSTYVGNSYFGSRFWNGAIDEVRVSSIARSADWIKTEYNNQNSPGTFYSYGSLLGWYSTSWSYRKPITIDHNKVSGVASSTLNSFPILINVTDNDLKFTGSGGKVASSTGADILFTDSTGTNLLNYEIESYASSTGQLIAWVRIPILSALTDTTIYEYFGNASASAESSGNITGTWDSNYKGVYHLPNGTTLSPNDSTSGGLGNGTNNGVTAITGQIDGGGGFNGSSQYINLGNSGVNYTNLTVEAWIYTNSATTNQYFISKGYINPLTGFDFGVSVDNSQKISFRTYNGSTHGVTTGATNIANNTWYHVVGTFNGTTWLTYVNGVQDGSATDSTTPQASGEKFAIGMVYVDAGNPTNYLNGKLDEARISNTARSADWIKTEYNNQNSPGTFYAYGALGVQNRATAGVNAVGHSSSLGWYSSAWSYRKPITIDHNKVSGVASSTLNSFPLLVSVIDPDLKYTGSGGKVASSTGGDILFTDSSGTSLLNYETEYYASTTGQLIAWVRIPILSAVTDTIIYEYFGNASAPAESSGNLTGTWDSNYNGVWHLPDGITLKLNDSTANAIFATNNSATAASGKIDGAASFSGGTQNISMGTLTALSGVAHATISGWMYRSSTGNNVMFGQFQSPYRFDMVWSSDGNTYVQVENGTPSFPSFASSQTGWHYFTLAYDGTQSASLRNSVYYDGKLQSLSGTNNPPSTLAAGGNQSTFYLNHDSDNGYGTGSIDEVRVSNITRSADWVKTEYLNQNMPGAFYAYGSLGTSSRQDSNAVSVPIYKVHGGVKFH